MVDRLLHARWIIPVQPDKTVLEDHAMALSGGRIEDILPIVEDKAKYRTATVEVFDHHALIPGLVNAHTNAGMSLLRGIADDRPLIEWLTDHIWPLELQWMSPDFVLDGTELAMAEMIRGGVTCFNEMYFFPEVTARQADHCGMRTVVGMIVVDFPSAWASGPEEYFAKGLAFR